MERPKPPPIQIVRDGAQLGKIRAGADIRDKADPSWPREAPIKKGGFAITPMIFPALALAAYAVWLLR